MLGGIKQKVLSTFSKVVQSRVKLWSLAVTSEILASGAFAGEFFNPKFGLKKRGLL